MPATLPGLAVALAGLVAGILSVGLWQLSAQVALFSAGGVALFLLMRRRFALRAMSFAALAFCLGALAASSRLERAATTERIAASVPPCELHATVLEQVGGIGVLLNVDLAICEGFKPLYDAGVVVLEDGKAHAGSKIVVRGLLLPLQDDAFAAQHRLLGAGARVARFNVVSQEDAVAAHGMAEGIRRGLRAATSDQGRRGALVRGLSIGDVEGLDDHTMERFRRAGLTHLVAVSGSNVAIVIGTVFLAARRLGPRARASLCALALAMFVLVVGPEPSVLRAAAMGGIALLALAWGRRAEPLHGLLLASALVVASRPALALSVGLHLSVAATLGIVLWASPLARRMSVFPRPVALALGVTLAAQFAVAPVLMLVFGEISLAGPLANALAAPAVVPATIFGVAAGALGAFSSHLGGLGAHIAGPFAGWILRVADGLGGAEWASVATPELAGWGTAAVVAAAAARSICRWFSTPANLSRDAIE